MRYAWINAGKQVENLIVADANFAALVVGLGLAAYCEPLPNESPVKVGWTYNPVTKQYAAPV